MIGRKRKPIFKKRLICLSLAGLLAGGSLFPAAAMAGAKNNSSILGEASHTRMANPAQDQLGLNKIGDFKLPTTPAAITWPTLAPTTTGSAYTSLTEAEQALKNQLRQAIRSALEAKAIQASEQVIDQLADIAARNKMDAQQAQAAINAQPTSVLTNSQSLIDAMDAYAKDQASKKITDTASEVKTYLPPENPVTNLKASKITVDSISLTWKKSANTATYILAYWESADTATTKEINLGNVDTYTLNGLKHCKYKIVIYSANYRSDQTLTSANPSASLEAAPVPDVPKKIKVKNAREGYCSVRLKGLDPNQSNIYQSEAVLYNSKDQKLGTFTGTDTGVSVSSRKIAADAFYYIKVCGYYLDASGSKVRGDWSDNYYFGTQMTTPTAWQQNQKVTLKWKPVTGAEGYKVYVSRKSGKGFWKVTDTTKLKTVVKKYKNKGLKAGKVYYFKLEAYATKEGSFCTGESRPKRLVIAY